MHWFFKLGPKVSGTKKNIFTHRYIYIYIAKQRLTWDSESLLKRRTALIPQKKHIRWLCNCRLAVALMAPGGVHSGWFWSPACFKFVFLSIGCLISHIYAWRTVEGMGFLGLRRSRKNSIVLLTIKPPPPLHHRLLPLRYEHLMLTVTLLSPIRRLTRLFNADPRFSILFVLYSSYISLQWKLFWEFLFRFHFHAFSIVSILF